MLTIALILIGLALTIYSLWPRAYRAPCHDRTRQVLRSRAMDWKPRPDQW